LQRATPPPYRPVTPAIAAELRAIAGAPNVLYGEPERMLDYAHDETHGAQYAHMPEAVVRPDGAQEIAAIMRLANRERIPVTPRGAGSGLSGGAVPAFGGIVLSLERMNRILEIDTGNLVAVVEPGVVTNEINEAVRRHGLFYAGYPMSLETCFIGGNVAENAGGGRAIKYGVTGRYVLGLEVVLPAGEIVELGGKRLKDVTGYDLLHLMVGSEGTLGVFTRIVLRLLPLPAARTVLLVPFRDAPCALAVVPRIIAQAHIIPASIEFMDSSALRAAYDLIGEKPPHAGTGALLLIELDGPGAASVEAETEAVVDACLAGGALDAYVGNTPATEKRMWRVREKVSEALTLRSPHQSAEDIVVPPAAIAELLRELDQLSVRHGVSIPCFGHAGDGNLHARIIKDEGTSVQEWEALKPAILSDLYRTVRALGGTISGEHGIGLKRSRYLPLVMDPALIDLQRRIKQAFDPLNILNPGKIFPTP
jgi:glycolate oxidase